MVLQKLDLLSSFFHAAVKWWENSTMNGYLFCLVCFSICMNISHKLFIFNLWSFLSPVQFVQSFEISTEKESCRVWAHWMRTSQWNEDHISYIIFFLSRRLFLFFILFRGIEQTQCYARMRVIWSVALSLKSGRQAESSLPLQCIYSKRSSYVSCCCCLFCSLFFSRWFDVVTCATRWWCM